MALWKNAPLAKFASQHIKNKYDILNSKETTDYWELKKELKTSRINKL